MKCTIAILCLVFVGLGGCAKKAAGTGQTATITLKDGTTAAGTVTNSDTSSITIQSANGVVSTYPMAQVSSVAYDTPPAVTAPASASTAPPAATPPDTSSQQPPPATASQASNASEPLPPQPESPAPVDVFQTIPAGRTIPVRTDQAIDAKTAAVDQTYSGTVARNVTDTAGQVAIPRGAQATLIVRAAREQGKVQGRSELALDVAEVRVEGRRYHLETSDLVEKGKEGVGTNRRTAKFAGGGAAFGSIIGAIAGGGKGAAIGALAGAAAGTGTQAATRGQDVRIPAETVLNFSLEAPVRIRELR
jgi:hypothetical protein